MGIKIDGLTGLRAANNDVQEKKNSAHVSDARESAVGDGFLLDDAPESRFSVKRQLSLLDPFVEIGVKTSQASSSDAWWSSSLVESLPPLPDTGASMQQGGDKLELFDLLRVVARDESYLKINWRDDFN